MSLQNAQQTRLYTPLSMFQSPGIHLLRGERFSVSHLPRNCSSHNCAIRWKQTGNRGRSRMHRPESHILRLSSLMLIRLNKLENQMIHIPLRNLLLTLSPSLLERNSLLLYPDIISRLLFPPNYPACSNLPNRTLKNSTGIFPSFGSPSNPKNNAVSP